MQFYLYLGTLHLSVFRIILSMYVLLLNEKTNRITYSKLNKYYSNQLFILYILAF